MNCHPNSSASPLPENHLSVEDIQARKAGLNLKYMAIPTHDLSEKYDHMQESPSIVKRDNHLSDFGPNELPAVDKEFLNVPPKTTFSQGYYINKSHTFAASEKQEDSRKLLTNDAISAL